MAWFEAYSAALQNRLGVEAGDLFDIVEWPERGIALFNVGNITVIVRLQDEHRNGSGGAAGGDLFDPGG